MLTRNFGTSSLQVAALGFGTSRTANLDAAAAAVARGPLPDTERARWENTFAPHAGVWPGEV